MSEHPRGQDSTYVEVLPCGTVPGALARPPTRAAGTVAVARRRCEAPNAAEQFPRALLKRTTRDAELLNALLALRRLGPEGHQAVEALLAVRRIAVLRSSWQLWTAIVEADGGDAEELLLEVVPLDVLEDARRALWGDAWHDEPSDDASSRRRLRLASPSRLGTGRS